MSDPNLTRQDPQISAAADGDEGERDAYDFGNRPELAGVVLTLFVIWLIFAFTG